MEIDRRKFLKTSGLVGASIALPNLTTAKTDFPQRKTPFKSSLNIGFIGTGLRGQGNLELALRRTDCNVVAICDPDQNMVSLTKAIFEKHSKPLPRIFDQGDQDYQNLLQMENLDAVIISTPWRLHSEMAIAAMEAGKYTGVEVCGGFSLDECWQLVNTQERTGVPLFFLENVCYRRDVMAVLNMVRQDLFGELIHLEGGYQHDLRHVKFNNGQQPYGGGVEFGAKGYSESKWRTKHSVHRNGDIYPTHGLGPVAQYLNLNRGNRMLSLTAMASKARGLHNYIVNHEKGGLQHPNAKIKFNLGDKVTTMIQTSNGETIVLHHDTNLPRPYSLGFRVQGTKGIWMDVNQSIYLEGTSPKEHRWEAADAYLKKYDHPLWKRQEQKAIGAGHGGMDYFLVNAFVECAKRKEQPPFDVYDAAAWLSITPLSEQSIAMGGSPVAIPDFTRGRWTERSATFAFGDEY